MKRMAAFVGTILLLLGATANASTFVINFTSDESSAVSISLNAIVSGFLLGEDTYMITSGSGSVQTAGISDGCEFGCEITLATFDGNLYYPADANGQYFDARGLLFAQATTPGITYRLFGFHDVPVFCVGCDPMDVTVFDFPSFTDIPGVTSVATPVPAALPLFASGLGLLGFAGWRKRRKVAA